MKKILFVFILVIVIAGAAFADHKEDKLGIGIMSGWYGYWNFDNNWGRPNFALSLKIPNVPIFWAINMGFDTNPLSFSVGVSGDKYFIERALVKEVNLHWYVGLGGWVNMSFSDPKVLLSFGARLPIGFSWHILDMLGLFLDIAPSLGIQVFGSDDIEFPVGGWPLEIGVRFWL